MKYKGIEIGDISPKPTWARIYFAAFIMTYIFAITDLFTRSNFDIMVQIAFGIYFYWQFRNHYKRWKTLKANFKIENYEIMTTDESLQQVRK